MNPTIRAFIAVELSDRLKESVARIQSELKKSSGDVKWVPPDICHITLKFLGEVQKDQLDAIRAIMDQCAGPMEPFWLRINSVGAFPDIDKPNIIWLGLNEDHPVLTKLASEIDEHVSTLGFFKENRPFTPHITIGRTRPGSHDHLSRALQSLVPPDDILEVRALTFFQSRLTHEGSTYYPLFSSPFK